MQHNTNATPLPVTTLALVDDHTLFRSGLRSLIQMVGNDKYKILFEADNGHDMQQHIIKQPHPPHIVLMDVNMPGMDGFTAVRWLRSQFPTVKVLVVSMVDKEETIIRMLKLGVKGYLSKDVEPAELDAALLSVSNKGYYYTDFITGKLIYTLQNESDYEQDGGDLPDFTDREMEFLQYACSEKTYNEIARIMFLSGKTVEGYRSALFEKCKVKSRTGLALYAVRKGLVTLQY